MAGDPRGIYCLCRRHDHGDIVLEPDCRRLQLLRVGDRVLEPADLVAEQLLQVIDVRPTFAPILRPSHERLVVLDLASLLEAELIVLPDPLLQRLLLLSSRCEPSGVQWRELECCSSFGRRRNRLHGGRTARLAAWHGKIPDVVGRVEHAHMLVHQSLQSFRS